MIAAPAPGSRDRVAMLVVDAERVMDSDAETLAAMIDASRGPMPMTHQRWRELLGRDALTRRFYRELEQVVHALAESARSDVTAAVRREIAILYASRLLFLAFLEAKGWLDGDREFLRHAFDARCTSGGGVHRRLLAPLFFGTLNTPWRRRAPAARALGRVPFLNGGLFARTATERRAGDLRFSDDALGSLIGGLLARYRVTAREESTGWTEAAVDPEMLGRAFESLMTSDDRRASGAFYTPSAIIERVALEGIEAALAPAGISPDVVHAARKWEHEATRERSDREARWTHLAKRAMLDPACGSGSFLVFVLETLDTLQRTAGDTRSTGARRREVLTRSIFGVDINPVAVWLCELRLWLSIVIDVDETDPLAIEPLPNLDRHIRAGDALMGAAFDETARPGAAMLTRLRDRYVRATGVRKRSLARALDREERRTAVAVADRRCESIDAQRRDLLCALRSRDLFAERTRLSAAQRAELDAPHAGRAERDRLGVAPWQHFSTGASLPFSFPVHFADVAARGGFELVVGNPPWVRVHEIPAAMRGLLRARFRAFRDAAWIAGAEDTGAGRGFAAQADLASLFVERSIDLAKPHGAVALLTPAKIWRSLAGGGVRQVVAGEADLRVVEDWTESRAAFDAATYPSLLVVTRRGKKPAKSASTEQREIPPPVRVAVRKRDETISWIARASDLPLDRSVGAPWLLVPPAVRAAFDRLTAAGIPLARTLFGRPMLGVKTGCNAAFLVDPDRTGVEPELLRPLLRGESVRAWRAEPERQAIVWTHGPDDAPRTRLPAGANAWLAPWRRQLEMRSDAHARHRWWALYRTEAGRTSSPRVVWSDIGKTPRALFLPAGNRTVPLTSCYVLRAPTETDALACVALLNSPIAAAWLGVIAEPARGGYRRFLGWTVARLPIPPDLARNCLYNGAIN